MTEYCISCGHAADQHVQYSHGCYQCLGGYVGNKRVNICSQFKLDNLKWIEDLAKERNLL